MSGMLEVIGIEVSLCAEHEVVPTRAQVRALLGNVVVGAAAEHAAEQLGSPFQRGWQRVAVGPTWYIGFSYVVIMGSRIEEASLAQVLSDLRVYFVLTLQEAVLLVDDGVDQHIDERLEVVAIVIRFVDVVLAQPLIYDTFQDCLRHELRGALSDCQTLQGRQEKGSQDEPRW
jgi:hypothetical protein